VAEGAAAAAAADSGGRSSCYVHLVDADCDVDVTDVQWAAAAHGRRVGDVAYNSNPSLLPPAWQQSPTDVIIEAS